MKEIQQLHKERGVANVEAKWQAYLEAVREARPGSPVYAPHPFPKKADEIIADFRHAYFDRLFEGTPFEKLPPREQFVYKALKENRLRIEIVRVENWTPSRCGRTPVPYIHLLRLFDPATGKEVARSTQEFTGIMGVYHNLSGPASDLPALDEIETVVRKRFGRTLSPQEVQYVSVGGLPYCSDHKPCVAFKAAGKLYLVDGGALLYEIAPTAPRTSVTALRSQRAEAGPARLGVTEYDVPMVTLGFEWAKARLVGGQKPQ